eukprot:3116140-Rhodomonas_salina.2
MVSPWYCDTHVLVLSYAALWSPKRYPALGSVEPRCDLVRSSSAVPYCSMHRVPGRAASLKSPLMLGSGAERPRIGVIRVTATRNRCRSLPGTVVLRTATGRRLPGP